MPRRARIALVGAATGTCLLVAVWYAAHYIGFVRRADVSVLLGFAQLGRPGLDRITNFVAGLCSPHQYVFLAAVPIAMALVRRRPRVAAMLVVVLLGANETTQLLKPLLAAPRDPVWWSPIESASWPSGHATAAMSLALCAVIAAPARRRPVVAAAMAAFAVAVSYSFLELGWHYPSDVLGGFLVAAVWTLAGVGVLSLLEARRAGAAAGPRAAGVAFSLGEAFTPVVATIAAAGAFAGLVVLARPHEVLSYVRAHEAFVVGACGIGVIGLLLAAGLSLMLRRT